MRMKKIDVHHHIAPDFYINALIKNGVYDMHGEPLPNWNEEQMLRFMERFDIVGIVASLSAPGIDIPTADNPKALAKSLSRQVNEGLAGLKEKYGKGFEAVATLPADIDDAKEELAYALDVLHLAGVALFTNYNGHYLGEDCFDELFYELNQRRAVAVLHPEVSCGGNAPASIGVPRNFVEFGFETTRAACSLYCSPNKTLLKYPFVKVILPHMGGTLPFSIGRLSYPIRKWEGNYAMEQVAGIETLIRNYWYDTAISSSRPVFSAAEGLGILNHMIFGSDAGIDDVFGPLECLRTIDEINKYYGNDQEALEKIYYKNAIELFPVFSELF